MVRQKCRFAISRPAVASRRPLFTPYSVQPKKCRHLDTKGDTVSESGNDQKDVQRDKEYVVWGLATNTLWALGFYGTILEEHGIYKQ
jgi:hypothetical protein